MDKVSAFQTVAADDFVDATNPRGEVSAHIIVTVCDIFGRDRYRRVSLGRYPTTISEAKGMISRARESQPSQQVHAEFRIFL